MDSHQRRSIVAAVFAALLVRDVSAGSPESTHWNTLTGQPPNVIGHRGDPYFISPHTLASYSIAISEGDTYIEPDLAMTKDGVLIVAHDPWLNSNTDVTKKFPGRQRRVFVDYATGWKNDTFASDLTLAELRTLRVVQDVKNASKRDNFFNGFFTMPTFEEMIEFVQKRAKLLGERIAIVPELKHVQMYARSANPELQGTAYVDKFLATLEKHGYDKNGKGPYGDVVVQCFDHQPLQYVASKTNIPGVQLVANCAGPETVADDWQAYFKIRNVEHDAKPLFHDWLLTPQGMEEAKGWAKMLAPSKALFLPPGPQAAFYPKGGCMSKSGVNGSNPQYHRNIVAMGGLPEAHELTKSIHGAGLQAVLWTFRNPKEDKVVKELFGGDMWCELQHFIEEGTDFLFVERSMDALAVIKLLSHGQRAEWCTTLGRSPALRAQATLV